MKHSVFFLIVYNEHRGTRCISSQHSQSGPGPCGYASITHARLCNDPLLILHRSKKVGNPYTTTERRVPELIPVLGSQPAGDVSHRLPLFSARPAVTLATLKRAAIIFAAW